MRYFDLYHGTELKPEIGGNQASLSFTTEAHGFGAVMAIDGGPDATTEALLGKMKSMTTKPLAAYSREWRPIEQHIVEIPPTMPATSTPEEMVRIEGGDYLFRVDGIEIEGSNDSGVDVQYPWEDSPRRFHARPIRIHAFYIDRYPVTNVEFKGFLDATHYRPKDEGNFLKGWQNGTYPAGVGEQTSDMGLD